MLSGIVIIVRREVARLRQGATKFAMPVAQEKTVTIGEDDRSISQMGGPLVDRVERVRETCVR